MNDCVNPAIIYSVILTSKHWYEQLYSEMLLMQLAGLIMMQVCFRAAPSVILENCTKFVNNLQISVNIVFQ